MSGGIGHGTQDPQGGVLTVAGCIEPGAVTRDDLMAHADGGVHPRTADHIRRCAACAAEVQALAAAQRELRRALHRFECPTPQLLGDYALALLAPHEQRLVAAHVMDCPRCGEELQTLRSFLSVEPDPSPSMLGQLKRVIATLVTPPRAAAVFAELRGSQGLAAPLIYRSEDVTLTVSVQPDVTEGGIRRWALHGLVVQERSSLLATETRLVAEDGTAHESRVDDLGNFVYEGLAQGVYQLEVALPERVVVAEHVPIGGG